MNIIKGIICITLTNDEYHVLKQKVIDDMFQYVWHDYNSTETKEYIKNEIEFVVDNIFKNFYENNTEEK